MLQNTLLFNQSSVSLEIIGLPDSSINDNRDKISIISKWKLMIIDQPLIEGDIDHLGSVMQAFYSYTNYLVNDEIPNYESKLIDIKYENFFTHNLLLKSSKPDVEPLKIKIGNSVLSDIINCFDQFNDSKNVRKITSFHENILNKNKFNFLNKDNLINSLFPPFVSICSLFFVTTTFIYFYKINEENNVKSSLNSKIFIYSNNSRNAIL